MNNKWVNTTKTVVSAMGVVVGSNSGLETFNVINTILDTKGAVSGANKLFNMIDNGGRSNSSNNNAGGSSSANHDNTLGGYR